MASQRVVLDPFAGTGTIGEANLACLRRPVFHQKIEQRDLLAMEGMAAECRPAREGYATWPRESRMRTAMAETSRGQPRYGQSLSCLSTLAPQPHPAVGLPFAIPACEGKRGDLRLWKVGRMPSDPIAMAFLSRRLDQLDAEIARLRADMALVMAVLSRIEASVTAPVEVKLERPDGE